MTNLKILLRSALYVLSRKFTLREVVTCRKQHFSTSSMLNIVRICGDNLFIYLLTNLGKMLPKPNKKFSLFTSYILYQKIRIKHKFSKVSERTGQMFMYTIQYIEGEVKIFCLCTKTAQKRNLSCCNESYFFSLILLVVSA